VAEERLAWAVERSPQPPEAATCATQPHLVSLLSLSLSLSLFFPLHLFVSSLQ